MKVLVVEADASVRRSLEFALAMRGHDADVVDEAPAALAQAAGQRYPLVIIGDLDDDPSATARLCRELRRMPGYAGVGILVALERDNPDAIFAALDAGATGYLSRPLDATQLRARIEEAERRAAELEQATLAARPEPATPAGERGAALLDLAADVVLTIDAAGRIGWAGESIERALGLSPAAVVGASLYTLCHPEDAGEAIAFVTVALDRQPGEPTAQAELRLLHQDGASREMELTAANLSDHPQIGGLALVGRDITGRRAREQALRRQALYDPLTELPNRALFVTYLEHALARADRRAEPVVVMFMDLDDFGRINERHGRDAGDAVLCGVAQRLRTALRATDTAARLGEDEFTILLEDVGHRDEAEVVASRVIDELREPFKIADQEVRSTASVGVTFSHPSSRLPDVSASARLSELLRQADIALYRAKSSGKDRWMLFDAATTGKPAGPAARATNGHLR